MREFSDDLTVNRRTFLAQGAAGAGLALTAGVAQAQEAAPSPPGEVPMRTLGRTGMKVSEVSVGAMRTSEPAILQAAFDRGVNYVDTARGYMGGRNESIVGEAIKGRRDSLFVATKVGAVTPKAEIMKSMDESLRALGTDYVDVFQLHMPVVADVLHPDAKEACAELKQQGKIKFSGVTTHSDQAAVLDAVATDPDRFYDVVLVAYNFESPPEIGAAIDRAAAAGLGIIAMKTQAGGYKTDTMPGATPHQAAIKWVLQNPNIHCCVPAMVNLQEVVEDTGAMGLKLTRADEEALAEYARYTRSRYCRLCKECLGSCPLGVDIPTVNRSLMYADGYNDYGLAQETYARLPLHLSAAACTNCETCTARCVKGLNIPANMARAKTLFA
ncbi:MAG: hypothetical protein AMXMBFR82_12550 [Candidatus Hydrogenedentota bacterium]